MTGLTNQNNEISLEGQKEVDNSEHKDCLTYNTSNLPLKLPEYGRLVIQMIDFALTIEDRAERTAYAKTIIRVMGGLNPQMRHVPDYQYKLWDHLAYLSDYKLDIDYPVEIRVYGENTHPNRLSYPGNKIILRHYGHLLESLVEELVKLEEGPERDALISQIAARMRRSLMDWRGDNADDAKIARDIDYYTQGKVSMDEVLSVMERTPKTRRGNR